MPESKPTENDYAMMLKRYWFKTRNDPKYKKINEQTRDLLKRGDKFQILRSTNLED